MTTETLVTKTVTTLADGRHLTYYDRASGLARDHPDLRTPPARASSSRIRYDAAVGEWVIIASHRQHRSHQPSTDECPLCPSRPGHLTEIPAPDYDVMVFENRGAEIGVTQAHPHGQIYAYPFATPRTSRMTDRATGYRRRHGRNLFEDLIAAEIHDGRRIVAENDAWIAFVPFAARWPYEVHLHPKQRHPDLLDLDAGERDLFPGIYLDLLRRFDRLFDTPAPYIAAWHQAPAHDGGRDMAVHLQLFTNRRSSGKLKYLAGSESGMDVFANDISPEQAAVRLRSLT